MKHGRRVLSFLFRTSARINTTIPIAKVADRFKHFIEMALSRSDRP